MDVISLAGGAVSIIGPFLPYLTSLGKSVKKKLEEVIAEQGGNAVWNQAQSLWKKITGRFKDDPEINGAAAALSNDPNNQMFQQMMVQILTKKLESDQGFAEELLKLMGGEAGVQKVVAGNEAWIENIRQTMKSSGTQEVKGGDKSVIRGVEQEQ